MKNKYPFLLAIACIQPAVAQILVEEISVPPHEIIFEKVPAQPIEVVVEEVIPGTPQPLRPDPTIMRHHLLTLPRDVVVPEHALGTVVETTETKNHVDVPGQPRRFYNVERNVVVVEGKELPYITIPVLFEKETAKLLDVESRVALEETAAAIHEVLKTQPTAIFEIEGHTSTDGTNEFNLTLSADRARRTHHELTQRYSVPAAALSANGYGEMYPTSPSGTEEQMVLDRRVLVARKQ